MLGQPITMLLPQVVGFKLSGKLPEGATATDLALTVTQMLRRKGVVDKFVEFFGDGPDNLPLADRATIADMAPEYGATCGIFPIDRETLRYLELCRRDQARLALIEAYAKRQGLWRETGSRAAGRVEFDLGAGKHPLEHGAVVIAESFEHIHRSNLVGFGVLPLKFKTGENTKRLGLCGEEVFAIGSLGERAGGRRRESGYRCRRGH